jgi:hypothetical protein
LAALEGVDVRKAFLGFTFLLAALFPIGGQLFQMAAGGMYASLFNGIPQVFFVLAMIATYALPALVTAWFFKSARLRERVTSRPPGATLMLIGVLLSVVHIVASIFASTIEGGGASFVVSQLAPLITWPARIVLIIGAGKFLLAADPSNQPLNARPRAKHAAH